MGLNSPVSLFYDLLKSAFQAFCKHGFDGVHKFIRSYNSVGIIPIYDTYCSSRNVCTQGFTKVTLSDPGFLALWRFRKSVKSRISEFACCHLLSHSVKDGNHVTYEKGRKCPSCFVLSIFKYKMGKINLLWAA